MIRRLAVVWAVLLVSLGACAGRPAPPVETPVVPDAPAVTVATFTPAPSPTPPAPRATLVFPTPTLTPAPTLRRLTEPGCCTQPVWSPDSRQVIFVDKPSPNAPAGFYAVDVTRPGAAPALLTDRMLIYSPDFQAAAYPEGDNAIIERLDTAVSWKINTRGNPPALSPDKSRVVWDDTAASGAFESRRTDVWLAELASENPKPERVLTVYGGGLAAWFPDSRRVLISARPALTIEQRVLSVLTLADLSAVEIARAERISGIALSPGGSWAAYYVSFAADRNDNGIWVARADGTQRRKLDWFGSYRWRDDNHILVVPMSPGSVYDTLWQVNAASGAMTRLTHPSATPFKIAGGDWEVSPDGRRVVFVSAQDKALWLLTFAVEGGK